MSVKTIKVGIESDAIEKFAKVTADLVDVFPEDVQRRIETELSGKISFLLLNKAALEKGRRPAQPDKEWPSIGLHDLLPTQFPEAQVERTPEPRQIDLRWSVYKKGTPNKPKSEGG